MTEPVLTPRPDGLPRRRRRPATTTLPTAGAAGAGAPADIPADATADMAEDAASVAASVGASTSDRSSLDLARRIVELAEDKKAFDIVLLDLAGLTTVADAFVICCGGSERQLEAIADGIIGGLRDERIRPFGREGTAASHWVLVDYGSVIVHVFTPPERDFYQLERHWAEAKTVLRVQ